MKYIILFSILFSQFSIAGNPDQDLIVDMARERFAASHPVALSDLKLGKTWRCAIYNAQRGILPNYNSYKELFLFEKGADGKIVNKKEFKFMDFEFVSEGLVSTVDDMKLYARVTSSGALIFEHVGKQTKRHKSYRSISDEKLRGIDYVYCQ